MACRYSSTKRVDRCDSSFTPAAASVMCGDAQQCTQGRGTAWAVWDAATVLALWLSTPEFDALLSELPPQPHVLELGAGTGLAGLAVAARLRESPGLRVTLTDLLEALPALQRNVDLNPALKDLVSVAACDWFDSHGREMQADVVLLTDCAWLLHLVAPLVATLDAVCKCGIAILVHQTRSRAVDDFLWAELSRHGFSWVVQAQPPGAESSTAHVYILRRVREHRDVDLTIQP
jgi:Lysine methyltransferase